MYVRVASTSSGRQRDIEMRVRCPRINVVVLEAALHANVPLTMESVVGPYDINVCQVAALRGNVPFELRHSPLGAAIVEHTSTPPFYIRPLSEDVEENIRNGYARVLYGPMSARTLERVEKYRQRGWVFPHGGPRVFRAGDHADVYFNV